MSYSGTMFSALIGVFVSQIVFLVWHWLAPDSSMKRGLARTARQAACYLVVWVSGLLTLVFVLAGHLDTPFRSSAALLVGGVVGPSIVVAHLLAARSRAIWRQQIKMPQILVPSAPAE